MFLCN